MSPKVCPKCRKSACLAHRWVRKNSPTAFHLEAATFGSVVGWATHWVADIRWDTAVPEPEVIRSGYQGPGPRKEAWELEPWRAEVTLWPTRERRIDTYDRRFKSKEDVVTEALIWFEKHGVEGDVLLDSHYASLDPRPVLAYHGPNGSALIKEAGSLHAEYEALYDGHRGPSSWEKYEEILARWNAFMRRWKEKTT